MMVEAMDCHDALRNVPDARFGRGSGQMRFAGNALSSF